MPAKAKMMEAIAACVIEPQDSPVEYQRRIVRNRHTGRLEEIDIHELPPAKPAVIGPTYAFARGEKVSADHPAVLASPGLFVLAEE
jgi:hypothetical protein